VSGQATSGGAAPGDAPRDPRAGRPSPSLWRNPFLWAAIAAAITMPILRLYLRRIPEPPPVLLTLPRFELIDEEGRPFSNAQLRGQVWVVDLFFTSCRSICPVLTRAMRSLQDRYAKAGIDGVHLLSLSVDPENDRPPVLKAYAQKHGADLARWRFLTGEPQAVRVLIVQGLQTHLGEKIIKGDLIDIAHASTLILVDGDGGVRGYYRYDERGLDEVFHRAQHVLRQQRQQRKGR